MSSSADAPLHEIRFQHCHTLEQLTARIYPPREDTRSRAPEIMPAWFSVVEIERGSDVKKQRMGGVDWLQSFMMAIEAVRRSIPEGEEDLWQDSSGVASWIILPRKVPVGWGYEFYKQICGDLDTAENAAARREIDRHSGGGTA